MKNFKLLLATTAILSMGAMTVKAEIKGESVNLPASVEIIRSAFLDVEQNLDFGKIVIPGDNTGIVATMDSSGQVSVENMYSGETAGAYVLTNGKLGLISGAQCANLSIPTTHKVYHKDGPAEEDGDGAVDVDIKNLACNNYDEDENIVAIYGEMHAYCDGANDCKTPDGKFNSAITITYIY